MGDICLTRSADFSLPLLLLVGKFDPRLDLSLLLDESSLEESLPLDDVLLEPAEVVPLNSESPTLPNGGRLRSGFLMRTLFLLLRDGGVFLLNSPNGYDPLEGADREMRSLLLLLILLSSLLEYNDLSVDESTDRRRRWTPNESTTPLIFFFLFRALEHRLIKSLLSYNPATLI